MANGWKALLETKPWSGEAFLRIARLSPERVEIVQPLTFKSYERHTPPGDEAALTGPHWNDAADVRGFMQAIVDLAWEEGIRPTGIQDQRNELKAVRDHLADMRLLALSNAERSESDG